LSAAAGDAARQTRPAPQVDQAKFRASMERLFGIYSDISDKADQVMLSRCPYKDAKSRCTARFECRNQFFTKNPSEKPVCTGSDAIDYRPAWVNGGGGGTDG
jgi:hypothetical protein